MTEPATRLQHNNQAVKEVGNDEATAEVDDLVLGDEIGSDDEEGDTELLFLDDVKRGGVGASTFEQASHRGRSMVSLRTHGLRS